MKKWEPESNTHIARRVGKTGEESCELGSVCARISIQGLQSVDPSSGKTNRQRLIEEMADVQAQINCNIGTILTDDEHRWFQQRTIEKMAQMSEWEAHYKPSLDSHPQAQVVATRQYYWKDELCEAYNASKPSCTCWHDEGTGPCPDGKHPNKGQQLTWRQKGGAS